jgi:hypothetical protein
MMKNILPPEVTKEEVIIEIIKLSVLFALLGLSWILLSVFF